MPLRRFPRAIPPVVPGPMATSLSRLLLHALLGATLCGGLCSCQGGEPFTDGDDAAADTEATAAASDGDASENASESTAAADADDGRPPSTGVAGGRDAERETLVVVEALTVGSIRDEVVVSAKVEARTSVNVFPKLSNLPVTSVHLDEGELVDEGDVLMTLFDTELVLAERTASTRVAETEKEVERAEHNLAEADKLIAKSERAALKARADFDRLERLVNDGLVNVQEVEDKRLAADDAEADLDLVRFQRAEEAIAMDLTVIKAAQAKIDWERAQADLLHATVRAPVSGVIAMRDCDVGELSSMSAPAFRVVDLSEPILSLRVPQDALPRLADGQLVEVAVVTNPDAFFSGKVRRVNPVLDEATGTVHVLVDLVSAPGLVPGLFCEARIVTAARDQALLVDKRAVLYEDDSPMFFALADDGEHVRKVPFQAGSSTPTAIEVLAPEGGEMPSADLQVVVVGQESLKDGARVDVREEAY